MMAVARTGLRWRACRFPRTNSESSTRSSSSFYETDPAFARERQAQTTLYRHAGRNLKWAALGFVVGLVLMVGRSPSSLLLAFVGFPVMFVSAFVFERNLRKMGRAGLAAAQRLDAAKGIPDVFGDTAQAPARPLQARRRLARPPVCRTWRSDPLRHVLQSGQGRGQAAARRQPALPVISRVRLGTSGRGSNCHRSRSRHPAAAVTSAWTAVADATARATVSGGSEPSE